MHVGTRHDPAPPSAGRNREARLLLLILGLAVAVAVAVTWVVVAGDDEPAPGGSAAPTATSAPTGGPTAAPGTSAPASSGTASVPVPVPEFAYQPLWPFRDLAAAAAWQQQYRTGGQQPWHLDPGLTATSFTVGHLGFAAVDRETSRRVVGREAWIGVGYALPDGGTSTAAVVHLARVGAGADAPWEVVGTRDSTLTLTTPAYGATVSSPLTAGGRITGVDESLRVAVIDASGRTLGVQAGIPAGGTGTPWSARVAFSRPTGTPLTVVVSTGGHAAEVERFAITGVQVPPDVVG